MSRKGVAELSNSDEEIIKTKQSILENTPLKSEYRKFKDEVSITNGRLLVKQNKKVIPQTLRKKVVKLAHTGHQGIGNTKSLLRSKVWFPNINKMVIAEKTHAPYFKLSLTKNKYKSDNEFRVTARTMGKFGLRLRWTIFQK